MSDAVCHNPLDSFFQVGSDYAGYALQRRFKIKFTNFKDTVRVYLRFVARLQHGFVAGAFPFIHQFYAQQPDHRVKPERSFDKHMDSGDEIVPVSYMRQFMCQDRFQLFVAQPV